MVLANTNRWRIPKHYEAAAWHLDSRYIDLDSVVENGGCGSARRD